MKRYATEARNRRYLPRVSCDHMPYLTGLIAAAMLAFGGTALAQGMLGNPADGGVESGIGVVSGYHCDAGTIEVQFDEYAPIEAAYGTSREDTVSVCGDADNGFGLLWNWNLLGPGQHTVRVLADGEEFDSATFNVNTLGQEFVTGLDLHTELTSLDLGKSLELSWQDGKQGFVITHVEDTDISMEDLIAALGGAWSGSWNAPGASGSVSFIIGNDGAGELAVSDVTLTNTGCAIHGTGIGSGIDVNDPLIQVMMEDGSRVEFEVVVTESLSAIGGALWVESGPCMDTDGIYYLFRD